MLRSFTIATMITLGAVAPVFGDEARPHKFAESVSDAIGFLAIQNHPRAFTRDTQIGDGTLGAHFGAHGKYGTDRPHRTSARTQVFSSVGTTTTRGLNGYHGFDSGPLNRIDR